MRTADAARGVRPVVLLADQYFARGTIRVDLDARRLSVSALPAAPAVRVSLVDLDGNVVCARDVAGAELAADRFTTVSLMCPLAKDSVATLAVVSLGIVDVAFDQLTLQWVR